jgi:DNA-binding response OmpR family regulator
MSKTSKSNQPTILIVEDEPDLLNLYTIKFKKENCNAIGAKNGEEAIKIIKQGDIPDAILLDILMPKMDGFQFLKELKEGMKITNIPIIILSNLSQEFEVKEGYRLSAVKYLIKANYTPEEVVNEVRQVLKK